MGRKYFSTGLATLLFCGEIVKIWLFSEVVWLQTFCLTFCETWPATFWPNLNVVPHSGI